LAMELEFVVATVALRAELAGRRCDCRVETPVLDASCEPGALRPMLDHLLRDAEDAKDIIFTVRKAGDAAVTVEASRRSSGRRKTFAVTVDVSAEAKAA